MTKALEVLIDGIHFGFYVPPEGQTFGAMVGNIPISYMRAHIVSGSETESWQWQLPDIQEGQSLTFRLVDVDASQGTPPGRIEQVQIDQDEHNKFMAQARVAIANAKLGDV